MSGARNKLRIYSKSSELSDRNASCNAFVVNTWFSPSVFAVPLSSMHGQTAQHVLDLLSCLSDPPRSGPALLFLPCLQPPPDFSSLRRSPCHFFPPSPALLWCCSAFPFHFPGHHSLVVDQTRQSCLRLCRLLSRFNDRCLFCGYNFRFALRSLDSNLNGRVLIVLNHHDLGF